MATLLQSGVFLGRQLRLWCVVIGLVLMLRLRMSVELSAGDRKLVMTPTAADPLVLPGLRNLSIRLGLMWNDILLMVWTVLQRPARPSALTTLVRASC